MSDAPEILPPAFRAWFAARGWTPRPHQLDLLQIVRAGRSALLVAPTGAGKTLAGFLPSLIALSERAAAKPESKTSTGLHTLYISPLKALAVDIARNLDAPIAQMALPVRVETRTGDTPAHKRTRQISRPPDILLTTPEQLALLIAHRDAAAFFSGLRCIILDELHALVTSKRGDLLSLALARLHRLSPDLAAIGLSATVREPDQLRKYLVPQVLSPSSAGGRIHTSPNEAQVPSPERERDRVRDATSPADPGPSPQPSPARERGRVPVSALDEVTDATRALLLPSPAAGYGNKRQPPMTALVIVQGGARADLRMPHLVRALP
ncbi:DEAD/DEAH box helicase, partial [Methylobacterium sp. J-048]|uniref:DEAD/DEAH box helicase n=1 Tax=Methylobacterium sp. J-048 TaxID=2836635 RepID=UPI001FBC0BCB